MNDRVRPGDDERRYEVIPEITEQGALIPHYRQLRTGMGAMQA